MADEKIIIDGEQYISSGRAASLVGYTKDYVGQLARDGKVKATRVGRNWYINEDSINKHKLSVHYTLTKPKKQKKDIINNENNNKNIDNLSNNVHDELEKSPTKTKDNVASINRENDLFPMPQKQTRDALVHTDIRYEDDSVVQAKKFSTHNTHKKNTHSNDYVGSVKIRKPVSSGVVRKSKLKQQQVRNATNRPVHATTASASIDGIMLTKTPNQKTTIHKKPDMRQTKHIHKTEEPHQKIHQDNDNIVNRDDKQHVHNEHNSKVVPVIGAIVIFTLFTVVYILFFIGNGGP